jgi:hypothetical protein
MEPVFCDLAILKTLQDNHERFRHPPGSLVFVDHRSKAETAIIALVAEGEFAWARIVIPNLHAYFDYGDWRDSREGCQIGLAMAGVDVKMGATALAPFLAGAIMLASVGAQEFEAHSRNVAVLSAHCADQQWRRDRQAIRRRRPVRSTGRGMADFRSLFCRMKRRRQSNLRTVDRSRCTQTRANSLPAISTNKAPRQVGRAPALSRFES